MCTYASVLSTTDQLIDFTLGRRIAELLQPEVFNIASLRDATMPRSGPEC